MKTKLYILATGILLLTTTFANGQNISTLAGNGTGSFSGDGAAATLAGLNRPKGAAVDAAGNVYIADADNNRIRKVSSSGIISTIAGNTTGSFSGDGGLAISATLNRPCDVKVDAAGNIFICDANNHCIRKINTSGFISTVAGTGGTSGFSGDGGAATAAEMDFPVAIALDASGNLYIADEYNNRIRKVNTSGVISTIIGTGATGYSGDGSPGLSTDIGFPFGVAIDATGKVYVSLSFDNRVVVMNTSGIVSTYAGTGIPGFSGDGGPATAADMDGQWGIDVDASGNLYIADFNNQRIRKVNTSGVISTVAGNGSSGFMGDGGLATLARLRDPVGVATGPGGSFYIADYNNHRVRKVAGVIPASTAPVFVGGAYQTLSVCQDAVATSVNSLLAVNDIDLGQTETWSTLLAPLHGTLVAAYSTSSTGATLTPTGLTYTPTAGYSGTDSFKVRVDDGGLADTTTVVVTINPPPVVGAITGADSVCPGATVMLSNATSGGVWSSSSTATATVSAAGLVTGIVPGTLVISYTVTNSCGTTSATKPFKVRDYAGCPTSGVKLAEVGEFEIYPNPGRGEFYLRLPGGSSDEINVTVVNVLGVRMADMKMRTGSTNLIDLDVPTGVYYFHCTTGERHWQRKVIVVR